MYLIDGVDERLHQIFWAGLVCISCQGGDQLDRQRPGERFVAIAEVSKGPDDVRVGDLDVRQLADPVRSHQINLLIKLGGSGLERDKTFQFFFGSETADTHIESRPINYECKIFINYDKP